MEYLELANQIRRGIFLGFLGALVVIPLLIAIG
jgi:hypothetical protein